MGNTFLVGSFCLYVIGLIVILWLIVPTRQVVSDPFPNVVIVSGSATEVTPLTHDNITLPAIDGGHLRGVYSHAPLFFHPTMERFIPWDQRYKATIWECTFWCSPGEGSKLALIHYAKEEKKNLFYIVSFKDEANSPVLYARSKYRKQPSFDTSFVSVLPADSEEKPKPISDWHLLTGRQLFYFDTPAKWIGAVVVLIGHIAWIYKWKNDDDDD
eukprot:GEMP01064950.1.p1 GENE.GEMP01064950.1~~GEMP01064950.1.p1  ORF type:complete len:214 (-),score=42.58 GEMP01064950.1:582-1223(-)